MKKGKIRNRNLTNYTFLILGCLIDSAFGQCPTGTTGYNCQSCITGCDVCDTSITTCDTCTTGYYLDSATSTCSECPSNCLDCSTPYVCTTCTPGYDTYTDTSGFQACEFLWWKWFLIIFGILLFLFLLGSDETMQAYWFGVSVKNWTRRTKKTKR